MQKSDTTNMMLMQPDHFCCPKVKDPRTIASEKFYDEIRSGVVKIHKTTRAGATVALCSGSIMREERFFLVCRTNRNITEAAQEETAKVVGHPINVIHIARNSFCPRIISLTKEYPAIQKLGFIPLPNCDTCNVSKCTIREAFETPFEKVSGYSLTYAKLQSLLTSENKKVKDLLGKLLQCRNIIFDEVQFLQEAGTVSVVLWEQWEGREGTLNLRAYQKLCDSSPLLKRFLDRVNGVINGVQNEIAKLREQAAENHYIKHLALSALNPEHAKLVEKQKEFNEAEAKGKELLQRLYPDKSWIEIGFMLQDFSETIRKEVNDFMKGTLSFNEIVKAQELLINAIKCPKKFDLTEEQVVALSKLLTVTNADTLAVAYVRGSAGEQISLQAQDTILYNSLRQLLSRISASKEKKRVVFTSATFGSINLEKLLGLKNIKDYIWGDPLNTSSKFLVIADKSRLSPFNFRKKADNIKGLIEAIVKRYGSENVAVCAMNKEWAKTLSDDCTWYGSDATEGVPSSKRIWIFVGLAEKPINAKDVAAIVQERYHDLPPNLQFGESLYYLSQKLRVDSVHMTTYQAISRAKDPSAKNRSVAIIIGARAEEVEKCLLWGPTRTLNPVKTEKGLKFEVEIEDPIGKPHLTIAPLTADAEESLHIIDRWISGGLIEESGLNWAHLKTIVDARGNLSAKRLIKVHGFSEQAVTQFLNTLSEFFVKEGINDYTVMHDSEGKTRGIAAKQYYENLGKSSIIYSKPSQSSIVLFDRFIPLKAAVDRAPQELNELSSRYFNHHVSSSAYTHLSEFLDTLILSPGLCSGWIVIGEKNVTRDNRKLIRDAHCLSCWAPDYPRRFGSPVQDWANNATELLNFIAESLLAGRDAFVSAYAFPDQKHPINGGNPPVSTLFIDIDVKSAEFSDLKSRWERGDNSVTEELKSLRLRLIEDVLKQAKCTIEYLKANRIEPRILLSGFKGLHLFVDFPAVEFSSLEVAKQLMRKLAENIAQSASQTYDGVNVTFDSMVMGDLSRLCRIPNSLNTKGCKLLRRNQYAVPVRAEELTNLTPEGYDRLCSAQRLIPLSRRESNEVLVMLAAIEENLDFEDSAVKTISSTKDFERINAYEAECTREVLTDEGFDDLNIRPCFKRVHQKRISLVGGNGHKMRIGAVMELARQKLSIPSMVRWFSFCGDYNPAVTEKAVIDLISRGYTDNHFDEYGSEYRKGMLCETIQQCGFCLTDECPIYQRKHERR